MTTAIAAMGVVVAASAIRGYRTQGRSALYQNALLGFGLHGFGHVGISVLARGYTSGLATSPTIVIPFWLWATRTLGQAGVPDRRSVPAALSLTAASLAGAHTAAFLLRSKALARLFSRSSSARPVGFAEAHINRPGTGSAMPVS